ncbi:hypothetical protein L3X38_042305 [Prunus dulcis]|uniref:Uncharacterized protein n=1 Tax=Prunus dulcis TaxID=3755 RepID=A0AAD4YL37_PRUDU|nr:hypothetical protein L3X38_042305 [Prunus dulcis]
MTTEEEDNGTSSTRGGSTRRVLSNDIMTRQWRPALKGLHRCHENLCLELSGYYGWSDSFQSKGAEPHGLSGGLCMFWKHGPQVELVKYAEFYIEVVIHDDEKKVKWHLLAIYASTNERVHCGQWHTLNKKILRYTEPCIVVGNFSDILDSSEKAGGDPRTEQSMAAFRRFLSESMLLHLGFDGYPFTCRNRRESGLIQVRLDRGLASEKWLEPYPKARMMHQILPEKL